MFYKKKLLEDYYLYFICLIFVIYLYNIGKLFHMYNICIIVYIKYKLKYNCIIYTKYTYEFSIYIIYNLIHVFYTLY